MKKIGICTAALCGLAAALTLAPAPAAEAFHRHNSHAAHKHIGAKKHHGMKKMRRHHKRAWHRKHKWHGHYRSHTHRIKKSYPPRFRHGHRPDCSILKHRAYMTDNAYWWYAYRSCRHDRYTKQY